MLKIASAFASIAAMALVVFAEGVLAQSPQREALSIASLLYDPVNDSETCLKEALCAGRQAISEGRYAQAEKSLLIAVREADRLSAKDISGVEASIWLTLAYMHQDKIEEASRTGNECLRVVMTTDNPDNLGWAIALTALGEKCVNDNFHHIAYFCYRHALEINENVFGGSHLSGIDLNLKLARLDSANHNDVRAETLARKAITMLEKLRPEGCYETAESWNLVGVSCLNQGKLAEAESCFQNALRVTENIAPEDDCAMVVALTNLGRVICLQEREGEAEPLLVRALTLLERDPQKTQKYRARANFVMGKIFEGQKAYGKAEQRYRVSLKDLMVHGEYDQPETIAYLDDIARILRLQERNAEADEMEARGLQARERNTAIELDGRNPIDLGLGDQVIMMGKARWPCARDIRSHLIGNIIVWWRW